MKIIESTTFTEDLAAEMQAAMERLAMGIRDPEQMKQSREVAKWF